MQFPSEDFRTVVAYSVPPLGHGEVGAGLHGYCESRHAPGHVSESGERNGGDDQVQGHAETDAIRRRVRSGGTGEICAVISCAQPGVMNVNPALQAAFAAHWRLRME